MTGRSVDGAPTIGNLRHSSADQAISRLSNWSGRCCQERTMRSHLLAALALMTLGVFMACGSSSRSGVDGSGQGDAGASGSGGAAAGASGSGGTSSGSGGTAGEGGSSAGSGGAGGAAGATGTGGSSAGGAGGAAACGDRSCTSSEVCVRPGCGGGVAVCDPLPDGGQCPSGWTESLCGGTPNRTGCVPPPCTPPTPFCTPLPSSCSGTPSCACLPQNICGQNGGQCGFIEGGTAVCGFA